MGATTIFSYTHLLFSPNLLALILDKSRSKSDLVSDFAVIFIYYKMANFDSITNENNKKWSYIPDHLYRILIINAFGSGKINALINLINEQDYIDKIYLYAKDLNEHEILIKKCENAGTRHDPNAFIECFNTMDDIYENINDYNPSKKNLIVFDDIVTDIMT